MILECPIRPKHLPGLGVIGLFGCHHFEGEIADLTQVETDSTPSRLYETTLPAQLLRAIRLQRRAINIAFAVLAVFVMFRAMYFYTMSDFGLYWAGAKALSVGNYIDLKLVTTIQHQNGLFVFPHPSVPYGSPALETLVFLPFTKLSAESARLVYMYLTIGLVGYVSWRAIPAWSGVAALVIVTARISFISFHLGNWAFITGLLVLLAYCDIRDGSVKRSSIWVALVSLFKVYPAMLFFPYLVKRRFKELLIGCAVLFTGVMASLVIMGWKKWFDASQFMLDIAQGTNGNAFNCSIPGTVFRHTNNSALATTLVVACFIASVGILIWIRDRQLHEIFAVACLLVPLSAGLSWNTYYFMIMPAILWLIGQSNSWSKWVALTAAALSWYPTANFDWALRNFPQEVTAPYMWMTVIITICVIYSLRHSPGAGLLEGEGRLSTA